MRKATSRGGGPRREGAKTAEEKAAEARRGPRRTGGPPHMALGTPTEKSIDFVPSATRLLGWLAPELSLIHISEPTRPY